MIGAEGFKTILRTKELTRAPLYLEVPGFEDTGPDKKNVDILKKIRQEISGGK
jgi:hypothetical protein